MKSGRPSKFDPGRAELILNATRRGLTRERAAGAAGIHRQTLQQWRARGEVEANWEDVDPRWLKQRLLDIARERDVPDVTPSQTKREIAQRINAYISPHADFLDRLTRADDEAAAYGLQQMQKVGEEDWRMWAWLLERRFPNDFGQRAPDDVLGTLDAGTEDEAQHALERATEIRIKMLEAETGT